MNKSAGDLVQSTKVQDASGPAASSSKAVDLYGSGLATKGSMTPHSSRGLAGKMPYRSDFVKDPRPKDKGSYLRRITELEEFLIRYDYPHPLTSKQLIEPSLTDFRNIFEFLISFLQPNYKMGKDMEVIVPQRLKLYGYPFSIPGRRFQNIGIPQAWPTIVLALTWLRLNIQASISRDFDTTIFSRHEYDFGKEGQQKLLFDYTNESYNMFMNGADKFDDLRAQYEKKFEEESEIDKEIEALTRERDQNKLIYEELVSESDNLAILEQHEPVMQQEIKNVEKYQLSLETHLQELKAEFQVCCIEEEEETNRLALLESEKEKKVRVVESQLQSGINFHMLMIKVTGLRRQVANRNQEISDRKINIQKLEAEINEDYEELNAIAVDFNRIRQELLPEDKDLELTVDIKENEKVRLLEKIHDMKTELREEVEALDEIITWERTKAEMLEECLSESEKEKASLCAALTEKDTQMTDLKEKQEKKLKEIDASMEPLKGQMDLKTIEAELLEDNERLQKEELAVIELEDRLNARVNRYLDFIEQVLQMMSEHRHAVQQYVRGINAQLDSLNERANRALQR